MFLYWEGYEIDGSDTDYDIVLPENREIAEFTDCFLAIPLLAGSTTDFYYYDQKKHENVHINYVQFLTFVKQGNRPELNIDINCKVMDELPENIQKKLYALSKNREPHETAYNKVTNPCMDPISQTNHTQGNLTVSLSLLKPGAKNNWYTEEFQIIDGFVRNESLMRATDKDYPCFTINVGPSFYYEYAMFIIEYLTDHFPGIGVAGGLDCGGGWTDGCTYSGSIYAFEKIQSPVVYSVKNTLKRLTEYDIVRSYRQYYKNGHHFDYLQEFSIVNTPEDKLSDEYLMNFTEYKSHVEKALEVQQNAFSTIYSTAIHIVLPKPQRFSQNPEVVSRLEEALADVENSDNNWHFTGYLAFVKIDGQPFCEFRIRWRMKKYFMTLLELVESGNIEYVKTETYNRRQHD